MTGSMAGAANPNCPLEARSLSKVYRSGVNELVVFRDLNLKLAPGERVALTGESGTGKSTLLHLLGLLDEPSQGQVLVGGTETRGLGEAQLAAMRNREIGFVWQMSTLLKEFTALENVMMPLLIRGEKHDAAGAAARARLEDVGLAERWHHRAGELSGGEQQRVVLARALAGRPRMLLADEPTGNLDERTGLHIMELLESVHEKHALATLYVTHNLGFAARAHRVLELRGGSLHQRR
ncbi:MAG: ABC transporter ATP-binding protein [Acidobacteria bacterium]|nr:ABC transporter ATP-binding protein [Acidobacteriota bacterium]